MLITSYDPVIMAISLNQINGRTVYGLQPVDRSVPAWSYGRQARKERRDRLIFANRVTCNSNEK